MKILVVNNYYVEHFGGIEIGTYHLVTRYRQSGHQVCWMAANIKKYPHACHPDDIPLSSWNVTEEHLGFPYPLPYPNNLQKLIEQVRWCDIIHLHDCLYLSNILIFWLSRLMRKAAVLTQHVKEVPYQQLYKKIIQHLAYKLIGRWALSQAEQVVFCSLTTQKWFDEFVTFSRPFQFIPHGVDTDLFQPALHDVKISFRERLGFKAGKPLFLFVGRFVEKKGIALLRSIVKQKPEWNWILIGRVEDEDPNTWERPNVRVLSSMSQQQLRDYYAAADLFVLPSVGEGFPRTAQESMACGTPVLLCQETIQALPQGHDLFYSVQPRVTHIVEKLRQIETKLDTLQPLRVQVRQFACNEWSLDAESYHYQRLLESSFDNYEKTR